MRYASFATHIPDPYRAGIAVGEGLLSLAPDVVILFLTDGYIDRFSDLLAGFREVLGPTVLLCGGSGDGVYGPLVSSYQGVVALGMAGEGRSFFSAAVNREVARDPALAAERAARAAIEGLKVPATGAFVMADGYKTDGVLLVEGFNRVIKVPYFGGLASSGQNFGRSFVFLNDDIAEDAVLVLGFGGDIPFVLNAASGWRPVGELGRVTSVCGRQVSQINDRPAINFFKDQIGKDIGKVDVSITVSLAEYVDLESGAFVLRTPFHSDENTGCVSFFGTIACGSQVRICRTSMDDIINGVTKAVSVASQLKVNPAAIIVISCVGRKSLLLRSGLEEIKEVARVLGNIPVIGMPSFGEIGPFFQEGGSYSRVLFHNVTFVVAVLGG